MSELGKYVVSLTIEGKKATYKECRTEEELLTTIESQEFMDMVVNTNATKIDIDYVETEVIQ